MSPVPRVPQRGDAARLQQLASGLKQEHGTYGAVVQRNEPGRPTGSGQAQQPQREFAVPQEHIAVGDEMAQAIAAVQFWTTWAQRFPGPEAELALSQAEYDAQRLQEQYFTATPNFEI